MTFLNPAFLWAALAIAVPILVHLFNFRRPRRVLFSNVAFVREVNRAVERRLKLRQWLLLAARIFAICFAVAAFANPVIISESDGALALSGNTSVAVVVDNSLSMSATDGRGVLMQQARLLAREIITSHTEADEFLVVPTSQLRLNTPFVGRGPALEALDKIEERDKPFAYTELLSNLEPLFAEARNANRKVYFISDFQRSTVLADTVPGLAVPGGIRATFMPVGTRKPNNLYVADIQFLNTVPEVGKPVAMELSVYNDGEADLRDIGIRATVEGREVSIGTIEKLAAGASTQTTLTFTPLRGGWQSGEVVLKDPDVEFDNKRYFSYYVPEGLGILLVEGEEKSQYVRLLYQNLLSQFRLKIINERELANQELSAYSVVVLAGPRNIASGLAQRLRQFVSDGGGLIFFPSANMEVPSVNAFYGGLGLGEWTTLSEIRDGATLARPDLGHLLFQGVFERGPENAVLDGPRLTRIFGYKPGGGGIQQTILQDQQNRPVLSEAQVGEGRVFTFTTFPSLPWGDFPLKSSFVPIVHRATLILSRTQGNHFAQTIGRYELFRLRTGEEGQVAMRGPEGGQMIPEQYERNGNIMLKFDYMDILPGNYGLFQNDSLRARVSFNLSDAESRLSVIEPDALIEYLESMGLGNITVAAGRPEVARASAQTGAGGFSLWKTCLALAVLLLAAEVAILKLVR